jgi:hypothetical protein
MVISDLNYLEVAPESSINGGWYGDYAKVTVKQYATPIAIAFGGGKFSYTKANANVYQDAYVSIYQ